MSKPKNRESGEAQYDDQGAVVYRVTDKFGDILQDGEYKHPRAALDRREREMDSHPDGELVTVEKVVYGWGGQ